MARRSPQTDDAGPAGRTALDRDRPHISVVQVDLPLADPDAESYVASELGNIDAMLTGENLCRFRRLHAGLMASGARIANGDRVATKSDVIRWLVEQL